MFSYLEALLSSLVHTLSLETFVFVASFVEEIIAPIPSPTVMLVAGSFAQIQERGLLALALLVVIGALGKTVGAFCVYTLSDKAKDIVLHKWGRFFGVTMDDVVKFQSKLGNGMRDYVLLTALRALPIMPSVLLSVGSGVLKINRTLFIFSTFFGSLFRDGIYLYVGYMGTEVLSALVKTSTNIETFVEYVALAVLVIFVSRFLYKKKVARATIKNQRSE